MISDKTYDGLMGSKSGKKSVIENYVDKNKTVYDLLVDFEKELKSSMGLPFDERAKDIDKKFKKVPLSKMKETHYNNITQITKQTAFMMNDILRKNGLTREKIDALSLPEYQKMCKQFCGKKAKAPTREMLATFKRFAKDLSITDVDLMKYGARFSLINDFQYRNLTESEMWLKIAQGRQVPDKINQYINKSVKAFDKSVDEVNFANALRATLIVTTYGSLGLVEGLMNVTSSATKGLPRRHLNAKKDVQGVVHEFQHKVDRFKEQEPEVRVTTAARDSRLHEVRRSMEREQAIAIGVPQNAHDMVSTKFDSEKDFLQGLMMGRVDKNTVVDFNNLTIYNEPLRAFDDIDKKDNIVKSGSIGKNHYLGEIR